MTSTSISTTESYLPEGLPVPTWESDDLQRPYWEGLRDNVIRVQRCLSCQHWLWGPEWMCHQCRSFDIEWVPIKGVGTIYSWSRAWHPVHPALAEHGPYIAVLVELPQVGNIRMMGNLLGDPLQDVPIGAPAHAVFEHHPDAKIPHTLLQWELDT